jgi:hypothetical protein
MCLLIAMALLAASYNFYEKAYETQAFMSLALALIIFTFFIYRMYKNRRCIFGDKRDCNKKPK